MYGAWKLKYNVSVHDAPWKSMHTHVPCSEYIKLDTVDTHVVLVCLPSFFEHRAAGSGSVQRASGQVLGSSLLGQ
jgi:hypothetical protein